MTRSPWSWQAHRMACAWARAWARAWRVRVRVHGTCHTRARTRAWRVQYACAVRVQCACSACVQCACSARAVRVQCACSARAVRVQCACSACVQCACSACAVHGTCGSMAAMRSSRPMKASSGSSCRRLSTAPSPLAYCTCRGGHEGRGVAREAREGVCSGWLAGCTRRGNHQGRGVPGESCAAAGGGRVPQPLGAQQLDGSAAERRRERLAAQLAPQVLLPLLLRLESTLPRNMCMLCMRARARMCVCVIGSMHACMCAWGSPGGAQARGAAHRNPPARSHREQLGLLALVVPGIVPGRAFLEHGWRRPPCSTSVGRRRGRGRRSGLRLSGRRRCGGLRGGRRCPCGLTKSRRWLALRGLRPAFRGATAHASATPDE